MASKTLIRQKIEGRLRRKKRIRKKVAGTPERPRLTVFRSARHIYAQVVDDTTGRTLAAASTLSKDLRSAPEAAAKEGGTEAGEKAAGPAAGDKGRAKQAAAPKPRKKIEAAKRVGALLAEQCKSRNIRKVIFDRNGYLYHGRVQALAQAAREAGLDL
jgi:large subunit ribosomal protein L18